ncbi:MAG: hypothetical protein FRX48_03423 [Lasallia pustulata]|uniref:Uncharacterized protein n=1 Tax=Lasallia pustulata TaxID=136370 RepID=A0A5M8PUS1_9LECA|nr:MAG: hypothetical protein FRX48_03423 [Lasallia pustulata]
MRKISTPSFRRATQYALTARSSASAPLPLPLPATFFSPYRALAHVQSRGDALPEVWFTSSGPPRRTLEDGGQESARKPPDERTLKLGKTLRTLQTLLPTLLASPLPPEILSPHITLHLFPSTHPHLPTVSGRVAYHAALWTAPMAWGRVPIVGNVKLIILSERVVKNGPSTTSSPKNVKIGNEKLIVRWKTCGKTRGKGMGALYRGIGASEQVDKITEWLGGDARDDEEFCGLFIFEFDEEGRIVTHTIEHAEEGGSWDRASRVVSVTDWLLGRGWRRKGKEVGGLAWECVDGNQGQRRVQGGSRN